MRMLSQYDIIFAVIVKLKSLLSAEANFPRKNILRHSALISGP